MKKMKIRKMIALALVGLAAGAGFGAANVPNGDEGVAARLAAAKSVWPKGLADEMNTLIAFRTAFDAPAGAEVRFDLVAWYSYRVTLNGEFVAFGPARGPKGLFRPDSLKLPVKAGRNELQVEVTGYNCRNFYLMKQPPFFKGVVSAGGKPLAVSDRDFTAWRLPRVQKVPRYSYQRTFSEAYVLPGRTEGPLALAAAPEPTLIPRVAPLPAFEFNDRLAPVVFSHVFINDAVKGNANVGTLNLPGNNPQFDGFPMADLTLNTAFLAQRLAYRDARPATADEKRADAFDLKGGDSVRFDVGVNDTGFPGATVTVRKPGRLVFTFDETLLRGEVHGYERYRFDCVNIIVWDFTEPGEYAVDAFEPYTMRWLEVGVLSGEMTVSHPHFRSYKASSARAAAFRASDPALGKIFDAAKETLMQNAVDVLMDCPSRERAGWNGDAYFTAPAATLLTGSTALERIFEENLALAASFEGLPDGMLPMCYPSDHRKDHFIPNWAMWFVLQTEEYLARSGDRAMVDALRPRIEKLVEFLWKFRNSDGLLEKLPSWVFVEWSKANDFVQDVNYPSNMMWSQVLDAVARLYGRKDLAAEAERVRTKIREQSWNGRFFRDHAVRGADGRLVVQETDITETCQYYAFFFGIATKELYPELWRTLLMDFGPKRDDKKTHPEVYRSAAFMGNYLRLKILEREGLGDQVLAECKGYFLKMAEETGTLWEHDDTRASCNQGFASHAAVLLVRCVLGIEKVDLLAKRLVLAKDVRAKLAWGEGVFPVGEGKIRVRRENGVVRVADVPAGWTVETREVGADSRTLSNETPLPSAADPTAKAFAKLKAVAASPNYYWAWSNPWLNDWGWWGDRRHVVEENGTFRPKPLADVRLECEYQKYAGGRRTVVNYADLQAVVGTWRPEGYYLINRAGLTAAIRKQWSEFGGLPVFNWHMDHPYCTNGFQAASYRFKSSGDDRNIVRQILDGTGRPCGTGSMDGKSVRKPAANPREWFFTRLKEIADFFNGLVDENGRKIPVVLRYPHECDGNWFWWGRTWCTADEFRRLCRMEADYLRKACGPDQILFAYTPDKTWNEFGKEGDSENTFLAYYPGDAYVDVIGIDDYSIGNGNDEKVKVNFDETVRKLRLLTAFADERGKVATISEAGGDKKRDDFWVWLHRAATAEGVKVAFVTTWGGNWGTVPMTEASERDERAFAARPQVLMEGSGNGFSCAENKRQ